MDRPVPLCSRLLSVGGVSAVLSPQERRDKGITELHEKAHDGDAWERDTGRERMTRSGKKPFARTFLH